MSPEPPGPRAQASPSKGTGGSGDENGSSVLRAPFASYAAHLPSRRLNTATQANLGLN